MDQLAPSQGYFSLVRWASDPTRAEARNVAVLLVDPSSGFAGVRSAPVSSISPRLHEQGLLDAVLVQLEHRFAQTEEPGVGLLDELHRSLERSLVVTAPQP